MFAVSDHESKRRNTVDTLASSLPDTNVWFRLKNRWRNVLSRRAKSTAHRHCAGEASATRLRPWFTGIYRSFSAKYLCNYNPRDFNGLISGVTKYSLVKTERVWRAELSNETEIYDARKRSPKRSRGRGKASAHLYRASVTRSPGYLRRSRSHPSPFLPRGVAREGKPWQLVAVWEQSADRWDEAGFGAERIRQLEMKEHETTGASQKKPTKLRNLIQKTEAFDSLHARHAEVCDVPFKNILPFPFLYLSVS